jgi:REP element-mobilizing transposase RayT
MAHTHVNCLLHLVFSTKNRAPFIATTWRSRLHGFLSSIAADRKFPAVIVGGVEDHVHLLVSLPADRPICDCVRLLKGISSKWANDELFPERTFAWQAGYGAFAIGPSLKHATVAYIENQEEHHRERTFQEEYREFLKRQGIVGDERYMWG